MSTINGPFYTNVHDPSYSMVLQQWKYTCVPKKSVPLPYRVGRYSGRRATGYWNYNMAEGISSIHAVEVAKLYPRAYDKFYSLAFKRASLGISLLEGRQTFEMVARRAKQLAQALRYLKRGNLKLVVSTLGIDKHPRTPAAMARARSMAKSPSNQWLEFNFGWAPAVADMFSVVDVFQQDFPAASIKAKVRAVHYSSQPWDGGSWYSAVTQGVYYVGGDVIVTNPNTLLAKSLGLTNSASILWDAVPFSFVVDWIIPVNKFLLSLDNDFGIEIRNPYRGWGTLTSISSGHVAHDNGATCVANHRAGERVVGAMPRPGLFDRLRVPVLDPWKATTALALLSQQWKSVAR